MESGAQSQCQARITSAPPYLTGQMEPSRIRYIDLEASLMIKVIFPVKMGNHRQFTNSINVYIHTVKWWLIYTYSSIQFNGYIRFIDRRKCFLYCVYNIQSPLWILISSFCFLITVHFLVCLLHSSLLIRAGRPLLYSLSSFLAPSKALIVDRPLC